MRRFSKLLVLTPLLTLLGSVCRAENRKIVVFSPAAGAQERLKISAQEGWKVAYDLPLINAVAVDVGEGSLIDRAPATVPYVIRVDDDGPTPKRKPRAKHPPASSVRGRGVIPGGVRMVNAPLAWAITRGEGVRVAVLDTGIDARHPDFTHGIKGGYDFIDDSDDFSDDNGHGTTIAGIIGASNVLDGYVGVAPGVELYGVKVMGADGTSDDSAIIAGLGWAVEHNMQIVNMSFSERGGAPTRALRDAVQRVLDAGIVLVASAGISGGAVQYPGAFPGVIAVAACSVTGVLDTKSGYGKALAFIAPGMDISAAWPGGGHRTWSAGPSMATAHVSGLAALAIARGAVGPRDVRAALEAAARPLPRIPRERQGRGLIDAAKLVGAADAQVKGARADPLPDVQIGAPPFDQALTLPALKLR